MWRHDVKAWVRQRMETIILAIGVTELAIGSWMAISPATFFDSVGGFGVENHHYIRDTATVYFALGIALVLAARRPAWRAPVLLTTALQYAFHSLNHLIDLGRAEPSWVGPFEFVTITMSTALLVYLFSVAAEER
jgi:hypothetical protein